MSSPDTPTRIHHFFSQLLSTQILLIFCWLLPLGNVQAQLVDIELYITKTTVNEEIGGVISYEFKIINLSPNTATGVVALIPFPAGLKRTVGFTPGGFNFDTGVWNVGTLEPWKNVTAGYTAEIGNIPPELTIYGQITAQDQQDVDSTPNNGNCCTANEDDESVLTVNLIDTGDDIDLELNIIPNTSLANAGNNVFYSVELTNHGPSNATGVSLYGQLSAGLHFTSGHDFLSSPSTIGNVRSGETIYRYVSADVLDVSTPQTFYAQVYGYDQTDSDSSPGNGICCTGIEDDEDGAILEDAMGAQIVDLRLELYSSSETDVGQDVYFNLLVYSGISSLPVNNLEIEILLPAGINVYNTSATVGTWDAANGIWTIPVLDPLGYNRIYFQAKVIDPPPLTFYAQVLSMDAIDGDATPGNGACCVANEDDEVVKVVEKIGCNCPAIFAPVCGSDGNTYPNSCEAECADIFDYTPGICNGQVDLELSLSTTNATPPIYSTTSLTATLTNNGIDPATGVSVRFPKPDGTVYLGSNEWSATQGTFLPFGSETWTVGILQPRASASLTVNYYMLTGDERTAYAQVATTNEEDVDSSPGNGVPPNVNEDDEAAVVLNGSVITCSINATVSNIVCNDHNTPNDPSDDWYSFTLSATNTTQSTGYQVYIPQTGQSYQGTYGSPIYIQSVPISFGNLILNLTDEVDVACIKNVTVTPPAPCSGTSGDIDLELSLAQPNASPVIYSNYDVVATLKNTGGQSATGVKVRFTKPTGVVYTGGNEFSASQGTFNPNGDQVWTVGTIPAGGSATLTVHYFLLQNNAPVAYAQVVAANEQDVDSTSGNGTPPSVNEDDEASTDAAPVQKADLTLANLTMQNSPIVPGEILNYHFDVSNIGTATASGNFNVRAWISMDNILGPGDIQGGLVTLSNLGAGATLTNVQGNSTVPSSFPDGDYFLFLKVDVDNDIAESNEDNNLISVPFVVDSGDGDLAELNGLLHEFIPGESNCYTNPGGSVGYLSVMVRNTGDVPATSFKVKFYLSTDDLLSSDDVFWSTVTVPFLDLISINGPAFVSPNQVVPASLALGKYYVITTIDEDNEVEELDETNNLIMPFQIQIYLPLILFWATTLECRLQSQRVAVLT
ncbi:MAG: CARDB domain-containing protein [Saprospiraceae bacterium]